MGGWEVNVTISRATCGDGSVLYLDCINVKSWFDIVL